MATHLQVVLKDDVENLGKSGQLVRVRPGFARNYLIPRGLAVPATRANVAAVEHEKQVAKARAAKLKGDAEAVAQQLSAISIEIAMQAGEGDRLFGSVGTKDIAEALAKRGQNVDRKKIILHENIKSLGEHEVPIRLGYDVSTKIKVTIVREG